MKGVGGIEYITIANVQLLLFTLPSFDLWSKSTFPKGKEFTAFILSCETGDVSPKANEGGGGFEMKYIVNNNEISLINIMYPYSNLHI